MSKQIFFHSNTTPRVCVCGVTNEEGTKLLIGAARCSAKNHYVKDIARKISSGRALKHPISEIPIKDGEAFSKTFAETAAELAIKISNHSTLVKPAKVTEAAKAEVDSYVTD